MNNNKILTTDIVPSIFIAEAGINHDGSLEKAIKMAEEFDKKPGVTEAYNHYIDQFENIICLDKHIYDYCMDYISSTNTSKNVWLIPIPINTRAFSFKPLQNKYLDSAHHKKHLTKTKSISLLILCW